MKTKDKVLIRGLKFIGILTLLSYIIFAPTIMFASPSVGKAFALGVPPIVLISVSWIIGYWYAMDRSLRLCSALTIGLVPARIALYCAWVLFVQTFMPDVSILAMILSSIAHWILFMIAEVIVIQAFLHVQEVERLQSKEAK